ncbi:hypothetical protein IH981_02950 [Patescibacteria group bacterium]|nr:hypothetical protein [Patescibacteria group bacterium]
MPRDSQGKFVSTAPNNTTNTSKPPKVFGQSSIISGLQFPLKLGLNITTLIILIIIVAVVAGGTYLFNTSQKAQAELEKIKSDPNAILREANKILLEDVGKIVDLPKGENPTIATVTDEKRLSDQPFFAKAKKGDKVLIYTEAKRAILYRPSTNKIIEIAPVRIGEEQSETTTKEESSPTEETP